MLFKPLWMNALEYKAIPLTFLQDIPVELEIAGEQVIIVGWERGLGNQIGHKTGFL